MVSAVAYDAAMLATRTAVIGRVGAIFDGLPDYRDGNMTRFVDMIVPVVQAGQARTGQLTAAYFGTSIAASEALTERRGTPPDEVYWRVAKSIYYALSLGSAVYDSVLQGRKRAVDLASTDLQLAKTSQIDWSMSQRGTGFYRRVLTGRENCALCVIASTQRYNVGNLMPIHPGCDCNAEEIRGDRAPSKVVDQQLLDDTHDAIAAKLGRSEFSARDLGRGKQDVRGNDLSDYTDLIITREHGEIGPLLAWRGDKFTSASDLNI